MSEKKEGTDLSQEVLQKIVSTFFEHQDKSGRLQVEIAKAIADLQKQSTHIANQFTNGFRAEIMGHIDTKVEEVKKEVSAIHKLLWGNIATLIGIIISLIGLAVLIHRSKP